MLIIDMPSPFGKDGYPDCTTCELRFYCQKPGLIDCPIKGELVRCGECEYNGRCMLQAFAKDNAVEPITNDWFCADGKRRE